MNIHYLKHVETEGLGYIAHWAEQHQHTLSGTCAHLNEPFPAIEDIDCLLILGGPQSIIHIAEFPSLKKEIDYIQQAITANKPVLGICLGAQLIATALGGKVTNSPEIEIGAFAIEKTAAAKQDRIFKHFPQRFEVMHWHDDCFHLPKDAKVLASSVGCPHQAVHFRDNVYGLQFHLEFTHSMVKRIINDFITRHKQQPGVGKYQGNYISTVDKLLNVDFDTINKWMEKFLNLLLSQ